MPDFIPYCAKGIVNDACHEAHYCSSGEGDKYGYQGVFNQVLAGIVFVQFGENSPRQAHTYRCSKCSIPTAFGNSLILSSMSFGPADLELSITKAFVIGVEYWPQRSMSDS